MGFALERRFLQISVLIAACVPVVAGGAGMIHGAGGLAGVPVSFDSHTRYLSGLLFAIGIGFWSAIPAIEKKTYHVRLLTFLVVTGGVARLAGAVFSAVPPQSTAVIFPLVMELAVTPLLCLWQGRVVSLTVRD